MKLIVMENNKNSENVMDGPALTFDKALFENMASFVDVVWKLDVKGRTIHILLDKLNPDMLNKTIPLDVIQEYLSLACHHDCVDRMQSYYSDEFLLSLKEKFTYENTFMIGDRFHTLQCVMTPCRNSEGNNDFIYITTRDIQPIVDEKMEKEKQYQEEYQNIIDCLYGANLGLWSIVLKDGAPRFYIDSTTAENVGVKMGLSPEENYIFWYDRIEPEYVPHVLDCIEKMLSGSPAEVIYPYNHPEFGKITIRCGGILDKNYRGNGIRIRGYHQDISDYNEKLLKEIEISNALLANFNTVVSIDFENDNAKVLWDPYNTCSSFKDENDIIPFDLGLIVNDLVATSKSVFESVAEKSVLKRKLNGKCLFSVDVETVSMGWVRITFIPSSIEKSGELKRCLFLSESIDSEKTEEIERANLLRQTIAKEQLEFNILKSFSSVYKSMHHIKLSDDSIHEIKAEDYVHDYVENNKDKGVQEMMWTIMRLRVCAAHKDIILAFTDLSTLAERMKGKSVISIEVLNVDDRWIRFSFAKTVSEKEENHGILFYSRDIDEEKRKEESLELMLNTDALTGLYNRHAYEGLVQKMKDGEVQDNLWFVGIDVNGLKVTNDVKGHKAGDELIIGVAGVVESAVSSYGKVFRVGGDEFIAILNCSKEEMDQCLEQMEKNRKIWSGVYSDELSFSKGIVSSAEFPGCEISVLEKESDKRMYEEKRRYYTSMHGDRRNR